MHRAKNDDDGGPARRPATGGRRDALFLYDVVQYLPHPRDCANLTVEDVSLALLLQCLYSDKKWQDATGAFFCQICDESKTAVVEAGGISRSNMDFDVNPRGEIFPDAYAIATRAFGHRGRPAQDSLPLAPTRGMGTGQISISYVSQIISSCIPTGTG
jgi:hypothetical protein